MGNSSPMMRCADELRESQSAAASGMDTVDVTLVCVAIGR